MWTPFCGNSPGLRRTRPCGRTPSISAAARPDCKDCWARLYCAGGCAANALHATGDIHGTYEYGCKVFRKRMECALMMQVAQRLDPELAKNAVRFESDCDGCGEGNDGACEK